MTSSVSYSTAEPLETPRSTIQQLLLLPYLSYTNRIPPERIDIMKRGRPTPVLSPTMQSTGGSKFDTSLYSRFPWLTGCIETSRLYCWPCLLLAYSDACKWNKEGSVMCETDYMIDHSHTLFHKVALKTYSQILNILDNNENAQLEIVKKKFEVVSELNLEKYRESDAQLEKNYLEIVANTGTGNNDSIEILLKMRPVLATGRICAKRLEIARLGQPRPHLPNLKHIWIKVQGRYIMVPRVYVEHTWLAGCVYEKDVHCWTCLFFGFQPSIFITAESTIMKMEHVKFKTHYKSIELYKQLEDILKETDAQQLKINAGKIVLDTDESSSVTSDIEPETVDSSVLQRTQNYDDNLNQPICYNKEDNLIANLVKTPFSGSIISPKRLEFIQIGRPKPTMPKLKDANKDVLPYDRISWLTASEFHKKYYCWPCLLFSFFGKRFCPGYNIGNIGILNLKASSHSSSESHVKAVKLYNKVQGILKVKQHCNLELGVRENGEVFVKSEGPVGNLQEELDISFEDQNINLQSKEDKIISRLIHKPFPGSVVSSERLRFMQIGRPKPTTPKLADINLSALVPYDRISWLTASATHKRFYCWPCLLFNSNVSKRFYLNYSIGNIGQLDLKASLHSCSGSHVKAVKLYHKVQEILRVKQHCNLELEVKVDGEVFVISEGLIVNDLHEELDIKTETNEEQNMNEFSQHIVTTNAHYGEARAISSGPNPSHKQFETSILKTEKYQDNITTVGLKNNTLVKPGTSVSNKQCAQVTLQQKSIKNQDLSAVILKPEDTTARQPKSTFESVVIPDQAGDPQTVILPNSSTLQKFRCVPPQAVKNCLSKSASIVANATCELSSEELSKVQKILQLPEFDSSEEISKERHDLVKSGRPTPEFTKTCDGFPFLYQRFGWLAECYHVLRMFCWPCLLFCTHRNNVWTTQGLEPTYDIIENTGLIHEKSVEHIGASRLWKSCLKNQPEDKHIIYGEKIPISVKGKPTCSVISQHVLRASNCKTPEETSDMGNPEETSDMGNREETSNMRNPKVEEDEEMSLSIDIISDRKRKTGKIYDSKMDKFRKFNINYVSNKLIFNSKYNKNPFPLEDGEIKHKETKIFSDKITNRAEVWQMDILDCDDDKLGAKCLILGLHE